MISCIKKKLFFLFLLPFFIYSNDWVPLNGNWNTPGNWNPAAVPNAPDAVANFPFAVFPFTRNINLDISPIIGTLSISSGITTFSPPSSVIHFQGVSPVLANSSFDTTFNCSFSLDNSTKFYSIEDLSFSNPISGNGSLSLDGFGNIFTLSSANSYAGATNILNGTLRTSAVNTLPSNTAVVITVTGSNIFNLNNFSQSIGSLAGGDRVTLGSNSATILTTGNDNTNTTFSGVISGNGGLTKTGIGTFILSGHNTYSGATNVNNGILQTNIANALSSNTAVNVTSSLNLNDFNQSVGAISGSGNINLGVSSATILTTGNANSDTIFSGTISGSGNLTKTGTGKFSLSGNNTYTGATTINNGNISVQGSLSSDVTVNSSGILSGSGTITGNVANDGSIKPGNSIGTLSVIGDVNFSNISFYEVEFNPTSSDLLDVSGTVTIAPGASVELLPDFSMGAYDPFQRYTIIQTGAGVFGKFGNVISAFPAFIGELNYSNPNTVDLIVNIVPFSSLVGSGNPGAVAEYFDSLPQQIEGSDLDNIIEDLQFLTISEMENAFDQLHPAIFKGLSLVQENNLTNIRSLTAQRLAQLYNNCCWEKYPNCQKISIWGSTFYDNYSQKDIHQLIGFNSNSGGVAIGFDDRISKNNYLGFTAGYSLSEIKWHLSRGNSDINSFYAGLYYSHFDEIYFFNTSVIGSFNNFSGSRNINFPNVSRVAKNNHKGKDFSFYFDGGFILKLTKRFNLLPFASLDYLYLKEDGFTETNANSLNLEIKKSNYFLLRTELGVNFNKCFLCKKDLLADVKLSYVTETRMHGKHYFSNLVYQPNHFTVSGIKYNRNIFSPGFSISKIFSSNNIIASIKYDGEFGRKYNNNLVTAQLIKNF
ncbi:MAG: autotransporter domain-containing protein [Parachlamydiales bacterium]|jgi:autotransporter-associated beta strand protein